MIGCRTSQKSTSDILHLESAIWYNWTGGVPGTGGTNYKITLAVPEATEIELVSLKIDGKEMPLEEQSLKNNQLTIMSIESFSNRIETVNAQQQTVTHRTSNPESAQLVLMVNQKEISLSIDQFEKQSPKNYQ